VVGGGNTAVEEALFLTSFASKVTLVHRKDELRAEMILQERLLAHPKIEVIWDSAIDEVQGRHQSDGRHRRAAEERQDRRDPGVSCDGVFIAIGHAPSSELFKASWKPTPAAI
jgi:thioredoxin reductase (NADPH)